MENHSLNPLGEIPIEGGTRYDDEDDAKIAAAETQEPAPIQAQRALLYTRERPPPESFLFPFHAKKDKCLNGNVFLIAPSALAEDHNSSRCVGAWCMVEGCLRPYIRYHWKKRSKSIKDHFVQRHPDIIDDSVPGEGSPNKRQRSAQFVAGGSGHRAIGGKDGAGGDAIFMSGLQTVVLPHGSPNWANELNNNLNQINNNLCNLSHMVGSIRNQCNYQFQSINNQFLTLTHKLALQEVRTLNGAATETSDPIQAPPNPDGSVPTGFPSTVAEWKKLTNSQAQEFLGFYEQPNMGNAVRRLGIYLGVNVNNLSMETTETGEQGPEENATAAAPSNHEDESATEG